MMKAPGIMPCRRVASARSSRRRFSPFGNERLPGAQLWNNRAFRVDLAVLKRLLRVDFIKTRLRDALFTQFMFIPAAFHYTFASRTRGAARALPIAVLVLRGR